ncbi:MAG: anthranilate synthase component I [Oceanospirillaceae bacterium]|uniref:anthranilate synthase component I n=1 Tax=unclassified Thalassolituus TaxID=2624967 RepID=UPI000C09E240|nr:MULTISPECIES: anthranilate synthase component I [unclassified Thalassolituus]MAK92618.1 anthranilate synthase component I [Thalassolituus sp.]MAX98107.1 anthranilate synthase component I [Oceanospirillaceae bacterium]MAX98531.1 anthranilate synthase component I [Oceanospirillaceae bacterium]MBL33417.1 anthranilate synthase component I [Oceanospirillaceae bacterium]MBS54323.1 anthranilate synthase component I [Oceanospirillaceae bacterium]|tara:strand:- start:1539 stop:3023 length:1485 start_codon:yes stop_codon:yes gene_type:complete
MTPQQFAALAEQGFNRIPVAREVLADLDTPLTTFLKLANAPYSYLLESVQGGEKWGRYSMIGLPCREILTISGHDITLTRDGDIVEQHSVEDPLAFVSEFQQRFRVANVDGLPKFDGGLVGYFGYDTVRYIEPRLKNSCPKDELGTPDILLMVSEEVVVFDNLSGKLHLIVLADPAEDNAHEKAEQRIHELRQQLREPYTGPIGKPVEAPAEVTEADFRSSFGEQEFMDAVERIRQYIFAGDIMQCVPSQRLTVPYGGDPVNIYRALRTLNPSPYMYCMNLGDFHVVGSSPEILARLEDGEVTVRPIAGTRVRGATEEEDLALEQELLSDPKEIAEHVMLIDLGRNDVGRVAKTGEVEVTDQMVIERYSHVMHIVSNVKGKVKDGIGAMDVLRAAHPAGTLSGAPKIRAMEIIDEVESTKRGVYGGAVGYLSWSGNMDMAIAIRTAVIKDGKLNIQAGAGVVADSVPRLEWKETMNKGRAMFRAVAMAEAGLDQ